MKESAMICDHGHFSDQNEWTPAASEKTHGDTDAGALVPELSDLKGQFLFYFY